jgi:hypothetical protein
VGNRVRAWLVPEPPAGVRLVAEPDERGLVRVELLIVFAVTLGLSGVRSLISLLDSLLKPVALNKQQVAIDVPQAKTSFLDLLAQLAGVVQLVAWGALGVYLLYRAGIKLYLVARALNLNLNVLPSTLNDTWWRIPVLVLSAAANAWAEEALVVGYLISRLRQLGLRENSSVAAAAVLRGSYHLYQGFGGFVGNLVMGLVFGRVWQRTNRLWPLVIAHTLLDVVSFVGYAVLASHVSWLH